MEGRRRFFPRRFPPTREGWWFLQVTLVVGAAAVHAGAPYLMGIAVRNQKKRLPTFSLEVEDLVASKPVDRRCYYLKLPAGRVQETAYRNTLSRRGYHHLTGFRLSTRFPFGLIRKSRDIDAPMRLLVYPALCAVPDHLVFGKRAEEGRRQVRSPSRRGDFYGLREFRPGDDPRDIHWRASARRGRLFLRESEDESSRTVAIVLEDLVATPAAPPPGPLPRKTAAAPAVDDAANNAFEGAVSMAASLAVQLLRRGYHVGLVAGGSYLAPAGGATQAGQILETLALVQPGTGRALPTAASRGMARMHVRPGLSGPQVDVVDAGPGRKSA